MRPLLTSEEMDNVALIVSIRHRTRTVLEEKLREAQCIVTYYEKVIVASMPLADNDLVLMTVDTKTKNFQVVMRKVLRLISEYRASL